jgi:hypothetical protein
VGVHGVDVVGLEIGVAERIADRGDDRRAVRARAGAVEAVAPFAAAQLVAQDRRPAGLAAAAFSSTRAAPPSPMTKPSRFLEKGLDAPSGFSFWVESADSRRSG